MLFTALILISVNGEHDGLEQGVNLGHCDETAEMGDVSGLGLKKEEEIPIFLCLLVVREEPLL